MGSIELREVGPDDWRLWRELRLAALAEAPHAFLSTLASWQGEGDREARWRSRLAIPGALDLVAFLDGRPVGIGGGVPGDEPGMVELVSMWVTPIARRSGVGDALVEEIVRWAGSTGAEVVRLGVAEGNEVAAALYLRHGFVFTGELGEALNDGKHRERIMERVLPESRP